MTHEGRLGRDRRAERSAEELLETIVEDVVKAATMPEKEWWALSRVPFQPLAIPVSAGGGYRATQVGVDAAHELTDQIWKKREDYRQTIERGAFDCLSFRAIGQGIQAAFTRLPEEAGDAEGNCVLGSAFYQGLAADFRNTLDRLAEEVRTDVDRHIPCTLFHEDQRVPEFKVGPVGFRSRTAWIDHFVRDQEARSVIDRVEQRELTIDEVRQWSREPDSGRSIELALTIVTWLRGFSWVGTIRSTGHEARQSHRKMSAIVGLAIDALGLRFQVDDARRFTSAGRAYLRTEDRLATAVDDGRFFYGWSANLPGVGSAPGLLAAKMQAEREFLDVAGRILEAYVESRETGSAPPLVEAWVNALYWVGEARREMSDFMAVVKYGCAVDGLSGAGGNCRAMVEFAEAAFGPREADEFRDGAGSAAQAVERVYMDGRNNLVHGNTPGLLEDFSELRRVGDALLANLFHEVTSALAEILADKDSRVCGLERKHAHRCLKERLRTRHQRYRATARSMRNSCPSRAIENA